MTAVPFAAATLQARYPLPDWVVDSKFKQELTLAVAEAITGEIARWPRREGPSAVKEHAERVAKAARDALDPHLAWLDDSPTDGFSYPGDVLVSYISQLALMRPGEVPDPDRYRELLRSYCRHLVLQARRFRPGRVENGGSLPQPVESGLHPRIRSRSGSGRGGGLARAWLLVGFGAGGSCRVSAARLHRGVLMWCAAGAVTRGMIGVLVFTRVVRGFPAV